MFEYKENDTLIYVLQALYHEVFHRGKYDPKNKEEWTAMIINAAEAEKLLEDVKANHPFLWSQIDDGSSFLKCRMCKEKIKHNGQHWIHVDGNPRHPAEPENIDYR